MALVGASLLRPLTNRAVSFARQRHSSCASVAEWGNVPCRKYSSDKKDDDDQNAKNPKNPKDKLSALLNSIIKVRIYFTNLCMAHVEMQILSSITLNRMAAKCLTML